MLMKKEARWLQNLYISPFFKMNMLQHTLTLALAPDRRFFLFSFVCNSKRQARVEQQES